MSGAPWCWVRSAEAACPAPWRWTFLQRRPQCAEKVRFRLSHQHVLRHPGRVQTGCGPRTKGLPSWPHRLSLHLSEHVSLYLLSLGSQWQSLSHSTHSHFGARLFSTIALRGTLLGLRLHVGHVSSVLLALHLVLHRLHRWRFVFFDASSGVGPPRAEGDFIRVAVAATAVVPFAHLAATCFENFHLE